MSDTFDTKLKYNDDEVISVTQNIRMDLISTLVKEGIPDDSDDRTFLLKVMEQADHTAVANKKIVSDGKSADEDRKVARYSAMVRRQLLSNVKNLEATGDIPTPPELKEIEAKPGETDVISEELNYEEFIAKYGDD